MGIDPGLTRCGIGVIDAEGRQARLVLSALVRTVPATSQDRRLLAVFEGVCAALDETHPDAVSIERMFAQHNRATVLGTAQAAGVAMLAAAERGIPVAVHTPSEAKAAITGSGTADKAQVQRMVSKILGLRGIVDPPDAADALALALCHAWRGSGRIDGAARPGSAPARETRHAARPAAQRAGLSAEAESRRRPGM